MQAFRSLGFFLALALLAGGCATMSSQHLFERKERMKHGYLYYLDGAGGGKPLRNWSSGVRKGLIEAGYPGAGEMFSWETGLGLVADQNASVRYKRGKARELARKIAGQTEAYPAAPISVLGFSAGTAVAVFALEDLPPSVQVENVVLLGASLSEDYDLTRALRRIRGKLYLYTSTNDRMLGVLMPLSGTADRKFDDPGAGLRGFVLPRHTTAETRRLYAEKIRPIPWTKSLEADGDSGRHFDNVKRKFIRDHVAPLLMAPSGTAGKN